MSPSTLSIDVRVSFPGFELAVAHAFSIEGVTGLFGPSGSGKSTLLRVIAGFEPTAAGRVSLDDEIWLDTARGVRVRPERRPIGYMFQDGRLFPHLAVRGNLEYAHRRAASRATRYGFDEVVAALDLEPLLERRVGTLSGGERQRVALGRTLLTRPRLLLLDEPLAALDLARKAEILPYLRHVPRRFGIPVLYVSHSVDEIVHLTDAVVILEAGRVREAGSTSETLVRSARTATPYVEHESFTIVEARVLRHDPAYALTELDMDGQTWALPGLAHLPAGRVVRLRIAARDVELSIRPPDGLTLRNGCEGIVKAIDDEPASAYGVVRIDLRSAELRARVTRAAIDALRLETGVRIFALIKNAELCQERLGSE